MMIKINSYLERGMVRFFPKAYSFLINNGFYVEKRWQHKKTFDYLKDDHPDRQYFANFIRKCNARSILEIGAGSQYEPKLLKEMGMLNDIAYTIMDINKFWLEEGKKLLPEVEFKYGSINNIPLKDNMFDVVYSRHVLEHQPHYETPIKEMMRVSNDWLFLNVFRWSLQDDIIQRVKYYSNSYSLAGLLGFCKENSRDMVPFVQLKPGRTAIGENIEKNEFPNVQRTGDHLIIIMRKNKEINKEDIISSGDSIKAVRLFDLERALNYR
ncbi:MAG: class I SAM-dependent methyltransferase [Nitrospirota bacterium]|nr:class I SAM-dependent methyltransferase [Nitrospirota bacterium]